MCAESLARKGLAENRFHTLHVGHRQGRIEIVEDAPNRKADRPSVMIGSKSVEARSEVVANDDSLVALKILGHAAYPHPLLAYVPGKGSANHRCRPGGPSPLVSWVSQLTPWLTRAHVLSYPLPLVLCVVGSATCRHHQRYRPRDHRSGERCVSAGVRSDSRRRYDGNDSLPGRPWRESLCRRGVCREVRSGGGGPRIPDNASHGHGRRRRAPVRVLYRHDRATGRRARRRPMSRLAVAAVPVARSLPRSGGNQTLNEDGWLVSHE